MQTKPANNKFSWFKLNRTLHRDIGYFCIGMTLIFSISGIAVNHIDDWNPNYKVTQTTVLLDGIADKINSTSLDDYLIEKLAISLPTRTRFWESPNRYKLFLTNETNISVDFKSQLVTVESISSRPFFKLVNQMHLNELSKKWTYFSDFFAAMLIFLSMSALFMIKGKHAVTGKRGLIVLAGFICPLLFII